MDIVISSFFRTVCVLYLFKKLVKNGPSISIADSSNAFYFVLLLVFSILAQKYLPHLLPFVSVILYIIYVKQVYKYKLDFAFIITIVSYSIYNFLYSICSLIVAMICTPYYYIYKNINYSIISFINGILIICTIYFVFKIKRLKSGMSFLTNLKVIQSGLILCFGVLIFKTYANTTRKNSNYDSAFNFYLATFLLTFLLFTWWRRQIAKSYLEKLRRLEIQSLYDEIEEKDRLIQKLTEDNYSLSRIIHKDNKLIPAMEHSVTDFLLHGDFSDPILIEQYGKQLTDKLKSMTRDRKGILETYEQKSYELRMTGNVSIDSVLAYMKKKADENGITLEYKHTPENVKYLLNKISEEDLSHLLSDLLENALISMNGKAGGKLQIIFGRYQKEAYISIADSGCSFDIETLHSFGLSPHTTHEDSGGSGIGLMDIWKIKKKYRASIQILEYHKQKDNYTKKIIFSFNSKNHYVIQSYRHMDIINTQTRGDLYVIPADDLEKIGGETA